ncbi:LPS export ABC transporter permease LptF [Entomobacter blattae]|uniref:Lipopolysaccharide export system permease LptF/LptG n=1 Tax=Entomobacter blattae TaxID=2762277 RepID=A0A7H1NV09_9PROT|nr:LPS export ABC transporter permease LptF [Entomobacter blattae]QNT79619.1 Lipopolysaccharide export system permease LptF/LptG [Entomobacter blattae]
MLLRIFIQLSLLDRYILRQLMAALLATTSGLAALIWLTQSLRFVSMVVERGLSLWVFIQLTSLLMPSFFSVILPITTFVVVQFIYQRLSGDRELTVMQAAGLSPYFLAKPGIICAFWSMIGCFILNIWLVPLSYHSFRQYEFEIRNKMAAFLLQEGVFTHLSDTMTVYVRAKDNTGILRGILIEDDRQKDGHATIFAEQGKLVIQAGLPKVVLFNGTREVIDQKTGRLKVLSFTQNTVELSSSKKDDTRYRDAAEMSLSELFNPDPQEIAERDFGKLAVEAHRRLTSPLMAFSFALVALFSVLRGAFSRHGNILRPFLAVLTIVCLMAVNLVIQNLAGRNTFMIPFIWVEAILPGAICAYILFEKEVRLYFFTHKKQDLSNR